MKRIMITVLFLLFLDMKGVAQNYWQGMGLEFNYHPVCMYYDSVTEKSYIAGTFTTVNGDSANILVYDGNSFTTLPKAPISFIQSLIRYKNKIYAAGNGGASLASWDGNIWTVIEQSGNYRNMKVYNDKLYVLGFVNSYAYVLPQSPVAVWDDTAWSGLLGIDSLLVDNGAVLDIAFYKGKTYVGGNWHIPGRYELSDFMMHDGQSWQQVGFWGGDAMGGVMRLLIWRDRLYVAGMFVESPYIPGNCIAAWDGQAWHKLQEGVRAVNAAGANINDMIVYNDELWVGGQFYFINGRFVSTDYGKVAKWGGTQWCTVGTIASGSVQSFGTWKDELFAVGSININSNFNDFRVVKWTGGNYTDTCIQNLTVSVDEVALNIVTLEVYPVPAKDKIMVTLPKTQTGQALILTITDALGRYSKTEHQNVVNSTLEINLSTLPAGVYYLNISGNNNKGTTKFIKL